jgi:hypothetical protein
MRNWKLFIPDVVEALDPVLNRYVGLSVSDVEGEPSMQVKV